RLLAPIAGAPWSESALRAACLPAYRRTPRETTPVALEYPRMFQPLEETRPPEPLQALQVERLRRTLAWIAARNPDYHGALGKPEPADFRHLDDLRTLPLLTKARLRDAYPFGMACLGDEPPLRLHMSSGTTGAPIVNPYTAADVQQWREVMA